VPLAQQFGLSGPRPGAEYPAAALAADKRARLAPKQPQLVRSAEESFRLERPGK